MYQCQNCKRTGPSEVKIKLCTVGDSKLYMCEVCIEAAQRHRGKPGVVIPEVVLEGSDLPWNKKP